MVSILQMKHIQTILILVACCCTSVLARASDRSKQFGIFPRGGATNTFRDVIQISRQKQTKGNTEASHASFKRKLRTRRQNFKLTDDRIPFVSYHGFNANDIHDEFMVEEESDSEDGASFISQSSSPYIFTRKEYEYDLSQKKKSEDSADRNKDTGRYPIIYRYFGRSRARSIKSDSIPFIIFGPSADNFKIVSKILYARGFNVMVCERTKEQKEKSRIERNKRSSKNFFWTATNSDSGNNLIEGEALTDSVLNALKWNKAILVGCDEEAILALEAVQNLAPDRIAGLLLCGDLSALEKYAKQISESEVDANEPNTDFNLDEFLEENVNCPFSIIWDGDASSWSTSRSELFHSFSVSREQGETSRSVIIGGGLAPHRRLPEQFAWTLTRFVENRVSTQINSEDDDILMNHHDQENDIELRHNAVVRSIRQQMVWRRIVPPRIAQKIEEFFTSGSLLVTGRVLATAIIYISLSRVGLFQYHNLRGLRPIVMNNENLKNLQPKAKARIGALRSCLSKHVPKLLSIPGLILRNNSENKSSLVDDRDASIALSLETTEEDTEKDSSENRTDSDSNDDKSNQSEANDGLRDEDNEITQIEPKKNTLEMFFLDQIVS